MTIELKPNQARILEDVVQKGCFHSVDEALEEAFRLLSTSRERADSATPRRSPQEAGAHMRELRRGVKFPEGMTIREMLDEGRA